MTQDTASAYEQGLAIWDAMFPDRPGPNPHIAPSEIVDDWGRLVTTTFGSLWSRPGLSRRQRSMITVAALTALHMPQVRGQAEAALRNGVSRRELCEVVLHAAGYAGFPAGVGAMRILKDVFDAHPELDPPAPPPEAQPDWPEDAFARGVAFRQQRFGQSGLSGGGAPAEFDDDWWQYLTGTAFGLIWPRPHLALQDHSRVTLAVLQALHLPVEFRLHCDRALLLGIPRAELAEQVMHLAMYAGFPKAVEAMRITKEVFEARPA